MNELLTNPSWAMSLEEGPYGPWTVVTADDGRRLGVSVTPHRCRTHLLIHDVDEPTRTYWAANLPPTSNPWLRRVAELSAITYHWDTPEYRLLCEEGGLDPDRHRPTFDKENTEAGEILVMELNRTNAVSPSAANLVMDIVDYLRVDPWVSSRKSIETIRHEARLNAQYAPQVMDEVRELLSRLPALSRLQLV